MVSTIPESEEKLELLVGGRGVDHLCVPELEIEFHLSGNCFFEK